MTSTMPLLIILLVVMASSLFYLIQAEGGFGEFPRLMERVGIRLDEFSIFKSQFSSKDDEQVNGSALDEFKSGNSRYSQGNCLQDSDCFVGGCSGEVCGSEPDIVTTCEFSENFPSVKDFQCECVSGVCGWREK